MKNRSILAAVFVTICLMAGCSQKDESPATSSSAGPGPTIPSSPAQVSGSNDSSTPGKSPVATGKPAGSLKVGDKAICAVCAVKEGTKAEEEVKAVIEYKGQAYGFCNLDEKAEFISNPAKYAAN